MAEKAIPLVRMSGISKQFPGVKALDNVDFSLEAGEVHVLFGENGAGKSTLISILAGVYKPSEGEVLIDGHSVHFSSARDARAAGIGAVFQEFSLVPTRTVAENIFLGDEPLTGMLIDHAAMRHRAQEIFDEMGFALDVRRQVLSLSRAEQQMVEIAKAIHARAKILILDEPTASLTERETKELFRLVRNAKAAGTGIIYISHRIQEFTQIADRITVLRDGKLVGTVGARDLDHNALVEMMTGRAISEIYPAIAANPEAEPVLKIRGLKAAGVEGVDIDVRRGEVLGVAGLVGCGKSRAFRAAIGLGGIAAGSVTYKGRDVTGAPLAKLLKDGIFYLPSDRKEEGLMLGATAGDNIALSTLDHQETRGLFGLRRPKAVNRLTAEIGGRVDLSDAYLARTASKLSGGNQQKILFGKGLASDRDVYIFDEPTVGVDVGTRAALYQLIKQICEAGKAVVVISSDLPEAMNLAHRMLVFSQGRISASLSGDEIEEETILKAFFHEERQTA
ncbi:sugar ABC transporter ATP-binding protein [Martelella endophytica]|uniref:Sugar ABC transporter ATP-binding protein n=1 Tax=Martelella endophytica TaxID=1486262 RepID=A0A0D5LLP4_MAREN|nr:sugar ABC transporter ATP-binding protein [Martelella endophytica]AJY44855.1 sugar ABC transporter ATP-binding protein [Martelella endophytica]